MAEVEFKCPKCESKYIKIINMKTMGNKDFDALIVFFIKCTKCGDRSELLMYND